MTNTYTRTHARYNHAYRTLCHLCHRKPADKAKHSVTQLFHAPRKTTMARKTATKKKTSQPAPEEPEATPPALTTAWWEHHLSNTDKRGRTKNPTQARPAYPNRCPNCGAVILTGRTHDISAFPARANPTRLTPAGLALAQALGIHLYGLEHAATTVRLQMLDLPPSHGYPYPIIPAHHCHLPVQLPGTNLTASKTRKEHINDAPPF